MSVSFTKAQRLRAKSEGKKLCAVYTPHVSFGGPCTAEEHEEIVRFLHDFLKRRFDRLMADRLHAGQEVKGEVPNAD